MTDNPLAALLEAELEAGAVLAAELDRQREALVARDLSGVETASEALQTQVERFMTLAEARKQAMVPGAQWPACQLELVHRVREIEARIIRLAQLNQDLLADRLAYVGSMLSALGLANQVGYAPDSARRRPAVQV